MGRTRCCSSAGDCWWQAKRCSPAAGSSWPPSGSINREWFRRAPVEARMPGQLPDKPSSYTRHVLVAIGLVVLALLLWKVAPVLMLFFAGVVLAAALRAAAEPLARRLHMREVWA